MINASARNYQLIIDGLDCTSIVSGEGSSISGNDSHYEPGSGLVKRSANLVLKRCQGWTEDLDDRTNPRWARGKIIKIYVVDASGNLQPAPVIGHLYILDSEYDGINTLKIEACCLLSLLDFRTPAGEGACFNFGEITSLNTIAGKLLQKAGIISYSINLTGAGLSIPLQKLSNESYISYFGKLLWSNGYFAYQNNLGVVVSVKASLAPVTLLSLVVTEDAILYDRLQGNEQPVNKVKVSGVKRSLDTTTKGQTVKEIFGSVALVGINSTAQTITERITELAPTIDTVNRTVEQISYIEKMVGVLLPKNYPQKTDLVIAEYKVEKSYYEAPPNKEGLVDCNQPDEGRLIQKEIKTYTPYGVALAEFIENQDDAIAPAVIIRDLLRLIVSDQTITKYIYPIPRPINTNLIQVFTPQKINILEETYQPEGILYNDDPEVSELATGENLRLVEKRDQVWEEVKPSEWWNTLLVSKSLAEAAPDTLELIKEELGNNPIPTDLYFELVITENTVTKSNAGQAQPPAPERFPTEQAIKEDQLVGVAQFPSFAGDEFRERERQYSVDSPFVTSVEQLRAIAHIEGSIILGRNKGQTCSIALQDELFNAAPLQRINWLEPNGSNKAFLVDGLSVALSQNRFAISSDLIWIGTVVNAITTDGEIEVIEPIYATRHNCTGKEQHSGSFKVYEYDLNPTNHTISGTETHSGTLSSELVASGLPVPIMLIIIE